MKIKKKTVAAAAVDDVANGVYVGDHNEFVVREGTYKGSPMFEIHDRKRLANNDEFSIVVSFGMRKAQAILAAIDELKEYVSRNL